MPRSAKTREATKQETREALLVAGLAEFAAKGLDVPSLDAICARAGFTRGAFYVHFKDREDFLVAVMERVFASFLDAVIATGDDAHDLTLTVERFADLVVGHQSVGIPQAFGIDIHRVLDACARSVALRRRFVQLVQGGAARVAAATRRGQQAHALRDDVDPDALGSLLALLALGVIAAVDTGIPVDAPAAKATVLRLLGARRKPRRTERDLR